MSVRKGVLHVIATPIGNLSDITPRAVDAMRSVDRLYAEDTRHTGQLCAHLGIQVKLKSLHDHNEQGRVDEVLGCLRAGDSVGIVSDAGTPLISDPGYRIVAACHAADIPVTPVPGVSALTAALSVCGLPTDRFVFRGFLPAKRGARKELLESLQGEIASTVFFESKHRIVDTLKDMYSVFGDREICVARELTKAFETIVRGSLEDVASQVASNSDWQKGEFVLVLAGAVEQGSEITPEAQSLLLDLAAELAPRKATQIVSNHTGVSKKLLYQWLLDRNA